MHCRVPGRPRRCSLRLQDVAATPALLADFRDMRARMQAEGLFRSSKAYYACKAASTLALAATAVASLAACGGAWAGLLASAALLALFWQQTGWLAHDFLHHQVFAARRLNNAAGYALGNVCQVRPPAAVSLLLWWPCWGCGRWPRCLLARDRLGASTIRPVQSEPEQGVSAAGDTHSTALNVLATEGGVADSQDSDTSPSLVGLERDFGKIQH